MIISVTRLATNVNLLGSFRIDPKATVESDHNIAFAMSCSAFLQK
jgi:hypothetical protein